MTPNDQDVSGTTTAEYIKYPDAKERSTGALHGNEILTGYGDEELFLPGPVGV